MPAKGLPEAAAVVVPLLPDDVVFVDVVNPEEVVLFVVVGTEVVPFDVVGTAVVPGLEDAVPGRHWE